jgi:hypothetical protein
MRPSSKRVIGILLVTLSLIALPIAFCQVVPFEFVDFPCMGQQLDRRDMAADTRLAYCISIWPRHAISGGGIYGLGSSNQDETHVNSLSLKRDGLTLLVNGHPTSPGATYTTTRFAAFNPWVVLTSRFEVRNDGLMPEEVTSSASILFASGDVRESWFPSPIGPIMLIGGLWLVRRAKGEKARHHRQAEAG